MRVLTDADGTFLDLNGLFSRWLREEHDIIFWPWDITCHSYRHKNCSFKTDDSAIRANPHFADGGLHDAFLEFMRNPNVYEEVVPIPGSIEVLSKVDDLTVLTAMMSTAPECYTSKMDLIYSLLPHAKVWTCPSYEKHHLRGDIMIEDRADIARSFRSMGTPCYVIKQAWNELAPGESAVQWNELDGIINV